MMRVLVAFCVFVSLQVQAVWIDTTGKVTQIMTYAHTDTVLVTLDDPGIDVQSCSSKVSFALSKDMSSEARNRMYSFLVAHKLSGNKVTVSYNDVGHCESWDSNPSAYRKVVRLR